MTEPTPRAGGPTRKIVHIALLLVATLIAGWPLSGIIDEREARQKELLAAFRTSWGPDQTVHAPILVLPYHVAEGRPRQYIKIAPATLATETRLAPELKKRGLFAATVYDAAIEMSGTFTIPPPDKIAEFFAKAGTIYWDEAFVMLESSELVGMTAQDQFSWDGTPIAWRNCRDIISRDEDCSGPVVVAHPHLTAAPAAGSTVAFKASISLRGTGTYKQVLEGKQTQAAISAPWPTPSFTGTMLPAASTVTGDSFQAHWRAVEYSAQQIWSSAKVTDAMVSRRGPAIGVDLLEATPTYRMIHRASKYNILFVVLSFTTYFLFELLSGIRIHTVQYGLLGLSLTLFTLLLTSFAEPLGYGPGYGISAGLILLQASLYTSAVTRRTGPALIFSGVLSCLFGFLYVLLSLETYSLLVGSLALFLVLSAVMALTQRVDWSGERS